MKKALISILLFAINISIFAQTPESFKYQAVIRDATGTVLANQNIGFKLSILQNSEIGTVVYSETFNTTTNNYGLVNLLIGEGIPVTGTFSAINWSENTHYLKIEIDQTGGNSYEFLGTSKFHSVPYALQSKSTEEIQGKIISTNMPSAGQVLKWNGTEWAPADDNTTGGSGVDGVVDGASVSGTIAKTLTLSRSNGLTPLTVNFNDEINDNDSDSLNEIQVLNFSNDTLYLSNGGQIYLGKYSNLWTSHGNDIFNSNTKNVGVGLENPKGKFVVKGDTTINDTIPLFEVKNKDGQTVFAVYNAGVRIYVREESASFSNNNKGGFAVGGYRMDKTLTNDLLSVNTDSVRIYFDNQKTSGGGHNGGFAIKSFNGVTKTSGSGIMYLQEDNYFIGENSGINLSTGLHNSTMGYQAGEKITTGENNIFIGYQSGQKTNIGKNNNFIGNQAGQNNTDGAFNNFIGSTSGVNNISGMQNNFMGDRAGYFNTTGNFNTFIGDDAGYSNTTGSSNNFVGSSTGWSNNAGSYNNFFGSNAGYSNDTGSYNNFIGNNAGYSNISGNLNNIIGDDAGYFNTTGNLNNFIGSSAGYSNTTGGANNFIGDNAGYSNTTGEANNFFGSSAGYSCDTGSANNFFGNSAGFYNTYGNYNTFIGFQTGAYNTTGIDNIMIGSLAGIYNKIGSNNIFIGNEACGDGDTNVTNAIAIGAYTVASSNTVRIGNNAITSIGGYADWTNVSDKRFKKNIKENVIGLDFIMKLKPVTYYLDMKAIEDFNKKPEKNYSKKLKPKTIKIKTNTEKQTLQTGFLAQDVEKVAKELGYDFSGVDTPKNNKDHYGLRYSTFVVPLVKAVQEQQAEIENLKKEIAILKNILNDLKDK